MYACFYWLMFLPICLYMWQMLLPYLFVATSARQGNMDITASVTHMRNAFLNGVETSAQEAACLVLQLPITRMSREVFFLHTSPQDERTFLIKDFKTLQEMDPESEAIHSHNILVEYRKRPNV